MTTSLNIIDLLPKTIDIDDNMTFGLVAYPNCDKQLCIAYQDINGSGERIYTIVIDNSQLNEDDDLDVIEDPFGTYIVSNAITAFNLLYNSLVAAEFIVENNDPEEYWEVDGFEELDLDLKKESKIKEPIEVDEDEYIKIVNQDIVYSELVDGDFVESTDVRDAARYMKVSIVPRCWDKSTINGEFDNGSDPQMPGHQKDGELNMLVLEIDLMKGVVLNWPKNTEATMSYRVYDDGKYHLYDKDWKKLCVFEGYVPELCRLDAKNNTDYFSMTITKRGKIKRFPKDVDLQLMLNDIIYDAFILNEQY